MVCQDYFNIFASQQDLILRLSKSPIGLWHLATGYIPSTLRRDEHVGRFWGIIGRADLLLSECKTFVEPVGVVTRFLRAKGMTRRGRGAVRLFTEQHLQWARVLDWASGIPFPALDEVLSAAAAKRSAEHVPPKRRV